MGFSHQQLQTGMVTIDSMEFHGIYWVYFGGCTANHNCLGLPKNGDERVDLGVHHLAPKG